MRKEIISDIIVLFAEDGAYITNGDTFTDSAYLGKNVKESEWRDATIEEYEEWKEDISDEEAINILLGGVE